MRLASALAALVMLVSFGLWSAQYMEQDTALAQAGGGPQSRGQAGKYVGAGSCSVLGVCHGSATARTQYNVNQNENYIWLKKDKHARAYDVLQKPRSATIAKNLGLTVAAEKSPKCLTCHVLNVPTNQRDEKFQLSDGVSCEACHGPAENWIIEHSRPGPEGYKESLPRGMYDIRDLRKRAEKCVSCHLGDEEKNVDHEMIAAGHPILTFELDTFADRMPPHWKAPKGTWLEARTWAIGQAVALREAAEQLARRAQQANAPGWPEFAEFDCFACHHPVDNIDSTYYVRAKDTLLKDGKEWTPSWRQTRGFKGVAGIPPWDASHSLVFRLLVEALSPADRQALDQELAGLGKLMGKMNTAEAQNVTAAATRVAQQVDKLIPQIASQELNAPLVTTLLLNIAGSGEAISGAGFRVAGQAAMTLDALLLDYKKYVPGADAKAIDEVMQQLFAALEKPEQYDPRQFNGHLQTVPRLLKKP